MFRLPRLLGHRLRALAVPPWLLPALPYSSEKYGPPRHRATLTEYFARHLGWLREVYPSEPSPAPCPTWAQSGQFARFRLRTMLPPAYVFCLPRARLLGSAGWIVGENDTLLTEASFWREPDFPHPFATHQILQRKRARPVRRLRGRTLSLATDFAIGGFGHMLHDSLPRLHLIERAGESLHTFDHVFLPHIDTPVARNLLTKLDLPPGRIVQADPEYDFETEELVATSFPGTPGHIPAYVPEFLRTRFTPLSRPRGRRLFLSREGFRRDLSERSAVEKILIERRFEIIRGHLQDAPAACAEASIIVAQEGSNFMNALFCPPGASLLLLLPSGINLPYALTLATSGGHRLWIQETPAINGDVASRMTLDLDLFQRTIDHMLS